MSDKNLNDNWDEFEHEILESPTAGATIDEENVVHVRVFLKARHWIGDKNAIPVYPVTHGMGFMIPLKDMWTLAEGCETPFKKCQGRNCKGHRLEAAMQLVNKQADNPAIWFKAETAPEAFLQQELRKLHEIIGGKSIAHCGTVAIAKMLKEEN